MKKYELTDETINRYGRTLYRIRALRDFGDVKAGDLGGFVEKEFNLSHFGKAWVYDNAMIYDSARVYDCAQVYGNARAFGKARVGNNAWVGGSACIHGNAIILSNARVDGYASVYGDAEIYGFAHIGGHACVGGFAYVGGHANIVRKTDFLVVGCIGSRQDNTTFYKTKSSEIWVTCGCFSGSIEQFLKAVDETHGDNKHGRVYRLACQLAEEQIER